MKKLVIGLLAVAMMSFVSDNAKDKWISYTSELGKFSVKFPAAYEESTREGETTINYKVSCSSAEMNFMTSSAVNKSSLEGQIDELLDISLSTFVEKLQGTIITQENIEVKGVKGIYASIVLTESNAMVEYKVFMHDIYHYQVIAYGATETFDKDMVEKFFKSFKVLK